MLESLSYIYYDYQSYIVVGLVVILVGFFAYAKQGGNFERGGYLLRYGEDLTKKAEKGEIGPVIGRAEEIRKIVRTLGRRQKNNVVLIGKAGVGKTAIAEGLAIAIAEGRVPRTIRNKRVYMLDVAGLVAGTKYRGDFEKRLNGILSEVKAQGRNVILFIDELHALSVAGQAEGAMNAGDMLKPALARGELQMVGTTTPFEYEKYIKTDLTLERRFQPVLVSEPTKEETRKILGGIKSRFEAFHGLSVAEDALDAAVELSDVYLKDRNYPDKAIDLLDETMSSVALKRLSGKGAGKVSRADIKEVAEEEELIV